MAPRNLQNTRSHVNHACLDCEGIGCFWCDWTGTDVDQTDRIAFGQRVNDVVRGASDNLAVGHYWVDESDDMATVMYTRGERHDVVCYVGLISQVAEFERGQKFNHRPVVDALHESPFAIDGEDEIVDLRAHEYHKGLDELENIFETGNK